MPKLSKSSVSIRKKWQEEAVKKGDKDAKIIISQSQAFPVIFDLLRDEFRPLNITSIYEALKAIIPPPVLKACLDAMAVNNTPNDESGDSEDDLFVSKKPKKKIKLSASNASSGNGKEASFKDTVRVKMGRNANSSLYYLNQFKLENEGAGLHPDDNQRLAASQHQAIEKLKMELNECKTIAHQTARLLPEPKNDELDIIRRKIEQEIDSIRKSLTEANKYSGNASRRNLIQKRVDLMCTQWRQRKRKCIEFIDNLSDAMETRPKQVIIMLELETDEMVELEILPKQKQENCFS